MLELTKKLHTESILLSFEVPSALVDEVIVFMSQKGIQPKKESTLWRELLDIKENELPATCLRGARYREGMTQEELASKTGIPVRHISEMENEKRPIGAKNARLLGEILNIDPRLFRKI